MQKNSINKENKKKDQENLNFINSNKKLEEMINIIKKDFEASNENQEKNKVLQEEIIVLQEYKFLCD